MKLKIAVIHDWLISCNGAEKVLEQILNLYPQADLYSLYDFLPDNARDFIQNKNVQTSFLQRLPLAKRMYRHHLPLMPLAVEQFDLSKYDLVISSSYAVAKGVITGPDQLHISYVHSPIRYAWDLTHQYLNDAGLTKGLKSWMARTILHYLRNWDVRSANGVDRFLANSRFVASRIKKYYRREASVIYPPIDLDTFQLCRRKEDFYLTASRLVPYKKIDVIVKAFAKMPDKKLVVIGDGPDLKTIWKDATDNVTIMGYQPTPVLRHYMQKAKAFIFAAKEDFGIIPIEAQACGTPVIAYGKGGALETVMEGRTGLFFNEQSASSIKEVVHRFERMGEFDPDHIRQNAMRFSSEKFLEQFKAYVNDAVDTFFNKKSDISVESQSINDIIRQSQNRFDFDQIRAMR